MRTALIIPLFCLLTGCLAPGERDPTRYPWQQPAAPAPHPRIEARGAISPNPDWQAQPQPQPGLPPGSYCVMSIEQGSKSGITVGGNASMMACSTPANPAPKHGGGQRPARNPPGPPPPIKEITGPPRGIPFGSGIELMINPGKLTLQRRIDQDCMAYINRRPIQAKFHATMYTDHSAKVRRSDWDAASIDDRNRLIWDIAIHNSCVERRPSVQTIRIRDEAGRPLRIQRVSIALDCHGDVATEYPGQIWYRC